MKGVRQAVEGIEALLEAKAKGIDVNAGAIEEFKRQQSEVKAKKAAEAETADVAEENPAS
jgi:hypothetical protein